VAGWLNATGDHWAWSWLFISLITKRLVIGLDTSLHYFRNRLAGPLHPAGAHRVSVCERAVLAGQHGRVNLVVGLFIKAA